LSRNREEWIVDHIEFMPQHCKLPGLSSADADAAAVAATYLTHVIMHPDPATPFKQPGSEIMQVSKELAVIFDKMAPQQAPTPRVLEPTPRVMNLTVPSAPSPRVSTARPAKPTSTTAFSEIPHHSPRQHQPAIISQHSQKYHITAQGNTNSSLPSPP
jgi:hypothetical protein